MIVSASASNSSGVETGMAQGTPHAIASEGQGTESSRHGITSHSFTMRMIGYALLIANEDPQWS